MTDENIAAPSKGATLEMLLQLGMIKSAGILFVAFQERFYSSSSVTSLLSTVQNICQSLTGFLVMTFGVKITTYRNLLFLASTISSIAYVITSQATDIRLLLFSHGVLQGIAIGMSLPPTVTMVSLYFEKRRGLANSIAVGGGPIGGIIFAPLITNLLSTFGYQGCVLIIGGILLNGCVSGALFRSTSFYTKQCNRGKEEDETEKLFLALDKTNDRDFCRSDNEYLDIKTCDRLTVSVNMIETLNKTPFEDALKEYECHKIRSYSTNDIFDKEITELYNGYEKSNLTPDVDISIEDIRLPKVHQNETSEHSKVRNSGWKASLYHLSKICNYEILTNPLFLAFLVQGALIASGTIVTTVFVIPFAKDNNITSDQIVTLVSAQSSIDLFSRIITGYISDKGWFRRSTIVAIASMTVSISSSLIRFYTTYNLLLGYAIVLGMVSGIYFSLYTVVLIDYLTLANFQTCLGFMSLVHGFSTAGAFYLVGYLRDISGSYVVPQQVTGAMVGVGSIIMFLLPVIQRLQK